MTFTDLSSMEQIKPDANRELHPTLPSSEVTFRLLVDQITDYAIFLLTPTGEVQTWNPGAERIKRYKPRDIIGRHFRVFYSPEAQRAKIPEEELRIASAAGRFEDEGWRIRKDGTKFWASVIITAIRDHHGELLGFGKVTRDLTERKRAEEQLRELSHSLLKTQDEERGRLGRALHDTFGQYLTALKISLDGILTDRHFDENDVRKRIGECVPLLERAIREVRTLSYLLYPPMLEELGLPSAIRWHLEEFSKRSGICISVEISDDVRLSKDAELALFRILQESLTNVHRHSGSKTASVRFAVENQDVVLEIKDRGHGLPSEVATLADTSPPRLGVGMRGMHERVRQLAGSLEITSNSCGTVVRAKIPLDTPYVVSAAVPFEPS
jgi:PAS domain S-box-containing protein